MFQHSTNILPLHLLNFILSPNIVPNTFPNNPPFSSQYHAFSFSTIGKSRHPSTFYTTFAMHFGTSRVHNIIYKQLKKQF